MNDETLREWEVKPIFTVTYPSTQVGGSADSSFQIWGVNRVSGEINRNWERIHSVEKHNQGYKKMPSDISVTIAVKEQSEAFEKLRRLGKSGTMFDLQCDLLSNVDENTELAQQEYSTYEWMQGFEEWMGCIITRESQTIEIGDIPVREFECLCLGHKLKGPEDWQDPDGLFASTDVKEGTGSPPTLDSLMA